MMRAHGVGRLMLAGGALFCAASCASSSKTSAPAAFEFAVIGDIPYSEEDNAVLQNEILPRIRKANYPFVIHVGDTKSGIAPCSAELDEAHRQLMASLAPKPVFYTPGDNEWTDCDRNTDPATGKPVSELASLERIRSTFFATLPSAPKIMRLKQQKAQPENLTWRYGDVRFVTLSVVGTNNGRDYVAGDPLEEATVATDARDAANVTWLDEAVRRARRESAAALVIAMQGDMTYVVPEANAGKSCGASTTGLNACDAFVALRAAVHNAAVAFEGPVLLVHGDTPPFTFNQEFRESGAVNLWRFNAAGDVHFYDNAWHGVRDASIVSFSPVANPPFSGKALVTGNPPDQH